MRPPAATAARNDRRSGLAWILRQFGAGETLLDRLADHDLDLVFGELKDQGARGDSAAVNILGWISGQHCDRREEEIDSYLQLQLTAARALPADDEAWFSSLVRSQAGHDRTLAAACSRLDPAQIGRWVVRQAGRGDPASQFLLSRDPGVEIARSGGMVVYESPGRLTTNQWLRKAADAGFAQATYELAWDIRNDRLPRITPASYSAYRLLKEAAESQPQAEANLATCEYAGCDGTAPDAAAALTHARHAAIGGQPEAFLGIGPALAAPAEEVAAWRLIHASLQQRGCGVSSTSVAWMKGVTEEISTAQTVPGAVGLATQIWERHGRQMLSALGCTS